MECQTKTKRRVRNKPAKRKQLFAKAGGLCALCGMEMVLDWSDGYPRGLVATIEHVKPLNSGGTNQIDNLQVTHSCCNNARGFREMEECEPAMFVDEVRRLRHRYATWWRNRRARTSQNIVLEKSTKTAD